MASFPGHLDVDAVLKDGSTVHVRPVRPDDLVQLQAFLEQLSDQSRLFRFFSPVKDVSWAARAFVDVDYRSRHGLIALHGTPERVVGHGFYAASAEGRAEVALEVADEFQGRGLGTAILGYLAAAAAEVGIGVFEAEVMPENHRMLGVFRDSGFKLSSRAAAGVIQVEFPTSATEEALRRFDEREHLSAGSAMKRFFEPSSIAVIGASRRRGSIGGEVFRNLLDSDFPGPVYPVSPHPVVQSVPAYSKVGDIPGPVDLGVIVVPAAAVVEAARQCAAEGLGALVVISSGFAEVGPEGRARQEELLEVCRQSGMRLIGPNCMGILNTDPGHRMNATFAPTFPPPGRVGFMSQSGALGLAVIDKARDLGLGISTFVSVGNKGDISGNDLLEYWEDDPATDVLMLYLESFGNPRRFSRLARRITRRKPILVVKSGRSAAGARATSSHTGALIAASDVTVDALFAQSGAIRGETLAEMFDVAYLLSTQAPPAGDRVGILTNAGGLGILCADACAAAGLQVPELSEATRTSLRAFLPPEASLGNPVDMIASAAPEDYERAVAILARSGDLDALIVIFIPPLVTRASEVAAAIGRAVSRLEGKLPVVSVFTSAQGPPTALKEARIPVYTFPEEAARALARVRGWARLRDLPEESPPVHEDIRRDEAHAIVAECLAAGGGWLGPEHSFRLLDCYGIPLAPWRIARTPDEVAAAAAELGTQVAVKAAGPNLLHKTEAGAIRLGLPGPAEAERAAQELTERLHPDVLLVQSMIPDGVEMIVGMVSDPVFGPVVACGAGGVAVELLNDVSVRLSPLTERDARKMVESLATYPLLTGYRGRPPADVAALRDVVLRVSALVEDQVSVVELDLNPVFVLESGAVAADVRIKLEALPPRPPAGARPRRAVEAKV